MVRRTSYVSYPVSSRSWRRPSATSVSTRPVYVPPPATSDWILATGFWRDLGIWSDSDVWED